MNLLVWWAKGACFRQRFRLFAFDGRGSRLCKTVVQVSQNKNLLFTDQFQSHEPRNISCHLIFQRAFIWRHRKLKMTSMTWPAPWSRRTRTCLRRSFMPSSQCAGKDKADRLNMWLTSAVDVPEWISYGLCKSDVVFEHRVLSWQSHRGHGFISRDAMSLHTSTTYQPDDSGSEKIEIQPDDGEAFQFPAHRQHLTNSPKTHKEVSDVPCDLTCSNENSFGVSTRAQR